MDVRSDRMRVSSREALLDEDLQRALGKAGPLLQSMRNAGMASLDRPEALRERARAAKREAMARLDEMLSRLEARVQERGGQVHWARSADEANRIVLELARKHGVRSVVKGKSMTTEEIGLNDALSGSGIRVSETDLGEFIIQLAGEPPSHIAAPAIHKTRQQVSELFARLGAEPTDSIPDMTRFARRVLRERFLEADMGVTGVNFAVASTGTIVLFENEGNIRLTTTLPRIHVAVMGMEKVIPTLADLDVLLRLLGRSATGQKLPSYVSLLHGPRGGGERDGPETFHLVILDNGRTRILGDPELRETLHCIRCSACLSFCPVYLRIGGHAYGWAYSGPIGSVLTPQLLDRGKASDLPYACTLCGACAEVCPVMIDLPRLMVALRRRYQEAPDRPRPAVLERFCMGLYARVLERPALYRLASALARIGQAPFRRGDRLEHFPPPLERWTASRAVRPFSRLPFHARDAGGRAQPEEAEDGRTR
jgi:L-lactate dehydrogenase complex protein LldF